MPKEFLSITNESQIQDGSLDIESPTDLPAQAADIRWQQMEKDLARDAVIRRRKRFALASRAFKGQLQTPLLG